MRCLILQAFGARREKLVIYDLFHKFSFRYNRPEEGSVLSALRYFKAGLRLILKTNPIQLQPHNGVFSFESHRKFLKESGDYLKSIDNIQSTFVFRDDLPNTLNPLQKGVYAGQLFFLFLFIFPVSLLRKARAKTGLILLELTEALLLGKTLKKNKAKETLIFSPFEKDMSFVSYFLQKSVGLKTTIIPSSNPISLYYQRVICNTFVFTAPYQQLEYETLKHNWVVEHTKLWPPAGFRLIRLNEEANARKPEFTVGLISSGIALRKHLGHTNNNNDRDLKAEQGLMAALAKLQEETSIISKLIIYLHPLEKRNAANLQFSKDYYQRHFKLNWEFAPFDIPSKACFGLCSVGISGFSSAQMERLFGGYKTLFAPMGFLNNFFKDPRLDAISAQTYEQLKQMLLEAREQTDNEFFEKNRLGAYRWDAYTNIIQGAAQPLAT